MSRQEARLRAGSGRRPSERVVEHVAAAEGVSPAALEDRLYDAIDSEALDSIVGSGSPDVEVTFRFGEYLVTVSEGRTLEVSVRSID
ncbi:HalOD1 output domain-containing protein [Halobaculum rarum]|uniref:HalOD1 output domain-containing protein n=1 Tax=Halobaculum rarum TaxID=3075122 RepID=UPI0032AF7269